MSVPEAAMHENDRFARGESQVGTSGQASTAKHVAQAALVKSLTHELLQRCAPLLHAAHAIRALGLGEGVGHCSASASYSAIKMP
jgi:hypothetical protein